MALMRYEANWFQNDSRFRALADLVSFGSAVVSPFLLLSPAHCLIASFRVGADGEHA